MVSGGVPILHRIIIAVGIEVEAEGTGVLAPVGILLGKPPDDGGILSGPEVIEVRLLVEVFAGIPEHIAVRQGGGELVAEGVVVIALGHRAGGIGELNHVAMGVVLVVALGAARDAPRQGQAADVLLYRGAGDLQCQLCD